MLCDAPKRAAGATGGQREGETDQRRWSRRRRCCARRALRWGERWPAGASQYVWLAEQRGSRLTDMVAVVVERGGARGEVRLVPLLSLDHRCTARRDGWTVLSWPRCIDSNSAGAVPRPRSPCATRSSRRPRPADRTSPCAGSTSYGDPRRANTDYSSSSKSCCPSCARGVALSTRPLARRRRPERRLAERLHSWSRWGALLLALDVTSYRRLGSGQADA